MGTDYRPVIAFLGAAREPVTAEWLAALVGCPAQKIRERALRRWQRFLHQDREQRTWRVVHRSFTDFLAEKMDEADWRAFQARIADRYLTAWGGLEAGLPGLHDLVKLDMDVRYGLRHLAAHLEAAGREHDLHRLMRLEWSGHQGDQTRAGYENVWYTVHERVGDTLGYLNDVDRAWQLAERAYAGRQSSSAIGLQCRYALIFTSLCSLAGNIPPALLAALVEKGVWLGLQGLAYARQIQEPELRIRALAAVAPYLNPAERDQALREAMEAARAIEYGESRSAALAALAPHLAELGHSAEALEAARAIESEVFGSAALAAAALAALAPCLAESGHPAEALEAARAIWSSEEKRSEALAALAPHLTAPLLGEALEAARAIGAEWHRFKALAALAPRLAPTERDQALREALEAARAIEYGESRSAALAALAPRLAPTERDQALCEALEAARAIGDEESRSAALAALASRLAPTERDQALREALEAARAIEYGESRSAALAALASRLAELGHQAEALEAAQAIEYEDDRSETLAALALRLAELPAATLYPLWSKTIRLSATRTREGLLWDLCALVPVLAALDGTEATAETFHAIQDVGRWWP